MTNPIKLYHYSINKIDSLDPEYYKKREDFYAHFPMKPVGLWVSVEDFEDDQTWKTWCEGEEFRLDHLKHRHLVKLKEDNNVLFINNSDELNALSLEYEGSLFKDFPDFINPISKRKFIHTLDWKRLALDYQGLVIAPYQWENRLMNSQTQWYYTWDCASGCIWDFDAIESFEFMELVFPEVESEKDSPQEDPALLV